MKSLRTARHRLTFGEGRENTFSSAWPFNCTDNWSHSEGVPLKGHSQYLASLVPCPLSSVSQVPVLPVKTGEQVTVPVTVGSQESLLSFAIPASPPAAGALSSGGVFVTLHRA